jgi:hypothetical protein
VVARGLAAASDVVLPGASDNMLERLAVTGDPGHRAYVLAEMLADDLAAWPSHGYLAIGDYDHWKTRPRLSASSKLL